MRRGLALLLLTLTGCTNTLRLGAGADMSQRGTGGHFTGSVGVGHVAGDSHAILFVSNLGMAIAADGTQKLGFIDVFEADLIGLPEKKGMAWRAGPHAGLRGQYGVFGFGFGLLPRVTRNPVRDHGYGGDYGDSKQGDLFPGLHGLGDHDSFRGPGAELSVEYAAGLHNTPPMWLLSLTLDLEYISVSTGSK